MGTRGEEDIFPIRKVVEAGPRADEQRRGSVRVRGKRAALRRFHWQSGEPLEALPASVKARLRKRANACNTHGQALFRGQVAVRAEAGRGALSCLSPRPGGTAKDDKAF